MMRDRDGLLANLLILTLVIGLLEPLHFVSDIKGCLLKTNHSP